MDPTSRIVVDIGSGETQAGFAGDEAPRTVFFSIVGRPRHAKKALGLDKDCYVGDEAQSKRGLLSLKYPIEHGCVTNWDDMEKIWHHTFYNELRVCPEDHPVYMGDSPVNTKSQRQKHAQILFETFEAPSMYIGIQGLQVLKAAQYETGLVVDCGDGVTEITPIIENWALVHYMKHLPVGGRDLTEYLMYLMTNSGYAFATTAERELVRDMKEKMCYVALDYAEEEKRAYGGQIPSRTYELPTGEVMTLNQQRFECTERLFDHAEDDEYNLINAICNTIAQCPSDTRHRLLQNIVLAGGTTLLPGFAERIKKELDSRFSLPAKVVAPPERRYSVWLGGSILAASSHLQPLWISKQEYEEHGPDIVRRKCF